MADISLRGTLCRHRSELWPTVGYLKQCVDTDLKCGNISLRGTLCRHRLKLWPTVGYMNLCVDADVNCGTYLVTWSFV